uniref:Uncharacterized protein n=1 Tax=Setaria digitata TaxID=48799 RepID=A0A915PZW2_9BILA
MDRRNVWNLVKENQQDTLRQQNTSRSLFDYDFNQQLIDVETVADAVELPPEKISEMLDEMVRERSTRKHTVPAGIRKISSKLISKLKSGQSESSKSSVAMDGVTKASESVSPILTTSLPAQRHIATTSSVETMFRTDERSAVLPEESLPIIRPTSSSYRSSVREHEKDTGEKCAYLFRGDSLYNNKPSDAAVTNHGSMERIYVYDPFCPIHGSRRRMISRKAKLRDFDYHLTSIESVDDAEPTGNLQSSINGQLGTDSLSYYSLIPASILAGCAGSCLWAAKCVYILECGTKYAHLNIEAQNVVIVRFFGYFFMVLHLGQVIGNLISSFILTAATDYHHQLDDHVQKCCGHLFRDNISYLNEQAIANLQRPPQSVYLSLCGVYFCCTIVALMIVLLFLNSLRKDEIARLKAPFFSTDICKAIFRNLTCPKPLLLVPLTFFSGIEQAFIVGLYTKAYIGCGLGIGQIGFVMTSFGVTDAICSLVFGPLMKLFGRMPLFVFGAVINMLIWPLNPGDTSLFYAIVGVLGMADGVWNTQISGLWIALSASRLEVAFANYRFWESAGFAFGLILTRFTNIAQFLLISVGMLLVGMICYLGVEFFDEINLYVKRLFGICRISHKRQFGDKSLPSMETSLISAINEKV